MDERGKNVSRDISWEVACAIPSIFKPPVDFTNRRAVNQYFLSKNFGTVWLDAGDQFYKGIVFANNPATGANGPVCGHNWTIADVRLKFPKTS